MIDWLKKTADEISTMAKNAMNTPAPIGKTIIGVLIVEGVVILLVTKNLKVIAVFA